MKIKIAFFVVGLNAGGIENYLLRFLTFYQHVIQATVYCKSGKTGDLEEEYKVIGANIVRFKIGYFHPRDFLNLKNELIQHSYESIVDFTGNFGAIPLTIGKIVGIKKRIVWYRNADDKFKKSFFKVAYNKIINKLTKRNATCILSNSKAAFDHFYKEYKWEDDRRFEVIYNGLDAKTFLCSNENLREEFGITKEGFVVGNVGRLNEQKNHKTAIKVALDLCKEYNDIYFIFCGKGVDEEFRDLVMLNNMQRRIILTGVRRDIINVLNTMNCFYFPSILEGQPNALIEAMVAGVPFVSSNIEPVKETIPKNLHQYLIPPLDQNAAKINILKIKTNEEFRNKFLIREWAISNFDSKVQFQKFFDKL